MSPAETLILDTIRHIAGPGGLAPIGAVRGKLGRAMSNGAVNATLYALAQRGVVSLHAHDYPRGMTARERSRALEVDGRTYVGAGIRA